jgi:iron complex transport system ATP-binding protein
LLGYVPAARELAWPLSVRDFVRLTARGSGQAAEAVLSGLKLAPLADRRVDTLSTGERTRVLLARALLPRPAVLLLDEPFANLDPLWQLRLAARLREEESGGVTILVSVHDLDLAARLGRRMLALDKGQLVADGAPDVLLADGTIERVFGVMRAVTGGWAEAR